MLNDFKLLSFDKVTHKLQRLKDIFDRLTLSPFEERLKELSLNFDIIDTLVLNLSNEVSKKQEENPNWPGPNPLIPPVPPPTPTLLPDLAIISIVLTVFSYFTNVAITIKNIGTKISPSTTLKMIIPDVIDRNINVPVLEIGDSITINTQHSYDPDGEEMQTTFLTEVNPDRTFTEISYSNNKSSTPMLIKSQWEPDGNTYIILHAHTPEGLEIGSYFNYATIKIGTYTFHSSTDINNHGSRILFNYPGIYSCQAIFNGITVDLGNIEIISNTTTTLIFDFPRTITDLTFNYSYSGEQYSVFDTRPEGINQTIISGELGLYPYRSIFTYLPGHSNLPDGTWIAGSVNGLSFLQINQELAHADISINVLAYGWHYFMNSIYDNIYADSGYHYPDFNIQNLVPVNLSNSTQFDNWFIQSTMTGQYPSFILYDELGHPAGSTYANRIPITPLVIIDAHTLWTRALFHGGELQLWFNSSIAHQIGDYITGGIPVGVNNFQEKNGTANIIVSSIPYDTNNVGW